MNFVADPAELTVKKPGSAADPARFATPSHHRLINIVALSDLGNSAAAVEAGILVGASVSNGVRS
jgi:hypothetical protein